MTRQPSIRWWLLGLTLAGIAGTSWLASTRLSLETDITTSLPDTGPELQDAGEVLRRNPNLDRIVVDLSLSGAPADPDRLVQAAARLTAEMQRSGLFRELGGGMSGQAFSSLYGLVLDHLPSLFSDDELQQQVRPMLAPDAIRSTSQRRLEELAQLGGVGQAESLARDPLGLRELVLARLAGLMPGDTQAHIYRNHLISEDNNHLLLAAVPRRSGADTTQAVRLEAFFAGQARDLKATDRVELTVVGGFAAALDNERYVRADTQKAVIISTVGITLLLLLAFPRPLLGVLALVPALAGLALALLVFSLLHQRISGLALGFGGALVSITVDHGVAFLLLLDRDRTSGGEGVSGSLPGAVSGRQAARDLWAVGLFATLTTVGAFAVLLLSGFPVLQQVGVLAGLGVGFSFLFVHTVFPAIFPALPLARRPARLPLEAGLSRLTRGGHWTGPLAAAALLLALSPLMKPSFQVDLSAMNTTSPQTRAAEQRVTRTWGDIFNRVYVLVEAPDLPALRRRLDHAADLLRRERAAGRLGRMGLSPSSLLPGPRLAAGNLKAWRAFWDPARRAGFRRELEQEAGALGFAPGAFEPFFATLTQPGGGGVPLPAELFSLLGLARGPDGAWTWFGTLDRGPSYGSGQELAAMGAREGLKVLDPTRYTRTLAHHISRTFLRMLGIIAAAVVGLLALLFLDPLLVLLTCLPLLFAFGATLGSLGLLRHPIDIPGLMLVIVVFGMGVDYSLFLVRSRQRFLTHDHPSQGPIRASVALAAASTLIGMLSLVPARHAVPRSAGITASLGIAFAALGALLILPPLLRRVFDPSRRPAPGDPEGPADPRAAVLARLRHLSPGVRLFARFKLWMDPMFPALDDLLPGAARLLDLGCGHGVPAAWLLARRRGSLTVVAIEPDEDRARVAAWLLGPRGRVHGLAAPLLPPGDPGSFDAALLLDMVHHLPDQQLDATLLALRGALAPGGALLLRAALDGRRKGPLPWRMRLERLNARLRRQPCIFRTGPQLTAALQGAGFSVERRQATAPGREETWFLCRPLGPIKPASQS